MRVKIIKKPHGHENGIDLSRYQPGRIYEITTALAQYLVAEGFARVEMRDEDTAQPPNLDRRTPKS